MSTALPLLFALEGPDGTGKTTHVRALREELTRRGLRAAYWQHPPPPSGSTLWGAALHYASAREAMVRDLADKHRLSPLDVLLVDRWKNSTAGFARVLYAEGDSENAHLLHELARLEGRALPRVTVRYLTAPDEVLDARLAKRGTPTTPRDLLFRKQYDGPGALRAGLAFDTSGDREAVTRALADHVQALLKPAEAPCATS